MSKLKILYYPNKKLRLKAKKVNSFNKKNHILIKNMLKTMYINLGVGLAATQINVQKRIIVIDISRNNNNPLVLINPKFLYKNKIIYNPEGCLSIPNYINVIPRFKEIIIKAYNQYGKLFKLHAFDLLSLCIQHEMDHLIGKLFIDYLPSSEKEIIKNKILKI
ncbi:Peptide deformylase [Candidatus Annandia adelgestsuga]|uniref:Peptide deformylase n=1 Tax=Candidatus Annandia adelgestsuga TaxID=1302411 RepID=A0A3Q9CKN8_9ENTR|nr:peptide deformylase [Candidatus Annandia adelgestsuga]AZP36194.1 Peptide deformylase [Candidatus Annandia adelgestsuga]